VNTYFSGLSWKPFSAFYHHNAEISSAKTEHSPLFAKVSKALVNVGNTFTQLGRSLYNRVTAGLCFLKEKVFEAVFYTVLKIYSFFFSPQDTTTATTGSQAVNPSATRSIFRGYPKELTITPDLKTYQTDGIIDWSAVRKTYIDIQEKLPTYIDIQEKLPTFTEKNKVYKKDSVSQVIRVPADGNCLFHSLSKVLSISDMLPEHQNQSNHKLLRELACEYLEMRQEKDDLVFNSLLADYLENYERNFGEGKTPGDFEQKDVPAFLEKYRKDRFWGGPAAIYAISKIFHARVVVQYTDPANPDFVCNETDGTRSVSILYSGFHYDAIVK
jgi:hypothetical protein